MTLSPRQLDTLRAFAQLRNEHGCPPTMVDVAARLGCTKVTTWEHVGHLVTAGCLEAVAGPGYARRYDLSETGRATLERLSEGVCCVCGRGGRTLRPTAAEESPAYRTAMRDAGRGHLLP